MATIELKAAAPALRSIRHAPAILRALVRGSEFWLVVVGAGIGVGTGLCVTGLGLAAQLMHEVLFGLGRGVRLSGALFVGTWAALLVPTLGGLFLGLASRFVMRYRRRSAIDPIEANALHGGRMSVTDSLIVGAQTLISNGSGASVGLEAGYTQLGAVVGSRLGLALRLRRADMRLLVGCGAAAAIAAAFGAPMTGAFYGFELIIGTYSVATVAPVMAAALTSTIVARELGAVIIPIEISASVPGPASSYLIYTALGFSSGLAGIAIMRGVTTVETAFNWTRVPATFRPAVGGVLVGALALLTPQVLGSGHAALHNVLSASVPLGAYMAIFLLKALASAISLGSGFRGGLFFASLFLGATLGKIFAGVLVWMSPDLALDPVTASVVGMSALAVAIVGGPLTMTFMALEASGDLFITGTVLAAAIVSSVTVRELFGYSFSTWRLHLRGETIRSAHDVGWIRTLTAGRMMRSDVKTVREDMSLAEFRNQFPIGSKQRVVAIDEAGRYAGLLNVADAYAPEDEISSKASRVTDLLHHRRDIITPSMNVKDAIAAFDRTESEALVVVDDKTNLRVLGLLTEQHALRRYAEELDKVRQGLSGTI